MTKTTAPAVPGFDRLALGVLEDVVAEADDQPVAGGEVASHADHLGDPSGLGLHLVGEVELEQQLAAAALLDLAVAEQVDELACVLLAGDEQHLAHAEPL